MFQKNAVPKIFVSDWAIFEDIWVCKKCKKLLNEPRRLRQREFEPTVDYKCDFCDTVIYEPKEETK